MGMGVGVGDESDLMGELSLEAQARVMASPSVRRTGRAQHHHQRREEGVEVEEEQEQEGQIVLPRPRSKVKSSRISLFARPQDQDDDDEHEDEDEDGAGSRYKSAHTRRLRDEADAAADDDDRHSEGTAGSDPDRPRTDRHARDQKLKESLWELRKMVHVFEGFEGSLRASKQGNEVGPPFRSPPCLSLPLSTSLERPPDGSRPG